MYGLVNKAIEDMVCTNHGQEIWQEIKKIADLDLETFISMEGYPDDVTHRLVKAASEVLEISSAEIMQAFGEYWVKYTAQEGYGEMLAMSGDTLPEFLENLDDMHARVGVIFPKLQPPSFECEAATEAKSLKLKYHSHRQGLAPMVNGLVKGLGERFDTDVEITQTQKREQGSDCDEFLVEYQPRNR
ncbi:heme NO-binding domain-containing protein [Pleurocapsales cyanobacterium LEGE 10410]|nr:heme NO-binding domain-containing protein [Pleurocapsales cyanobacterium LEGE 10410]